MRIRNWISVGLTVAVSSGLCVSRARAEEPAFASAPMDEKDRARDAMKEGVEAYKAGDYEKAKVALERSFQTRASHDAAGVLGQTYLALGDYRSASNYLAYCVDHYPTGGKRELLKKIQEDLATSSKNVLGLRVFSNVDGSSVKIDGVELGRTPADRTFLNAGEHTVVVTHPDGRSETRTIRGDAGETRTVTVAFGAGTSQTKVTVGSGLDAEPSAAAPKTNVGATDEKPLAKEGSSWKWPVVITTGVVGLAGLGVGAGFLVDSNGKVSDANALGSDACASNSASCERYLQLVGQSNDSMTMSAVGFGVGGAFLASSVLSLILWPDASERSGSASAKYVVEPIAGGARLGVSGSF